MAIPGFFLSSEKIQVHLGRKMVAKYSMTSRKKRRMIARELLLTARDGVAMLIKCT